MQPRQWPQMVARWAPRSLALGGYMLWAFAHYSDAAYLTAVGAGYCPSGGRG